MKTAAALLLALLAPADPGGVSRYHLTWETPSADAWGSMPLGNGDVALNAWVEPGGDLLLYLAKTDSWGDNGRLLKLGRLRLALDPLPWREGRPFGQTLSLADGTIYIRWGEGEEAVQARLWVDACRPAVEIDIAAGRPVAARLVLEPWRKLREELPALEVSDVLLDRSRPDGKHAPPVVEPDVLVEGLDDRIGWYHHNARSVGPGLTARIQGVADFVRPDPLLHRTFGGLVTAAAGRREDAAALACPAARSHRISIHVLTLHPSTPAAWLEAVRELAGKTEALPRAGRRAAHERWWAEFWERSWIHVTRKPGTAPPPLIPAGPHPLRAGEDQRGGNRFGGEIGRVSLFRRLLGDEETAALAAAGPGPALAAQPGLMASWARPGAGTLPEAPPPEPFAVEAWVRPAEMPPGGGRIVDRITPGGSDGFLLDTWPSLGLRLIAGSRSLGCRECLAAGRWYHVAAMAGEGALRLYLDGRLVAAESVPDETFLVSRGYALQRFVTACAGRGRYPIKFNGSLFTVPWPGRPGGADYRRWGPGYWWQNTRLPYVSLCTSGDLDILDSLFRMYLEDVLPVAVHRTRAYFGHGGAFLPECVYFWGDVFSETYGWKPRSEREDPLQENRYHKWEWVAGLELVHMLLDRYEHRPEEAFLRDRLLPAAREVLAFFAEHHPVDERGRLRLHPAQALETWWECVNPMPEVAGLHAVTGRLLELPAGLVPAGDRERWARLREKLPPLPVREVDGVRMLAPAEVFATKRNVENPELYAVFPFHLIAPGRPGLELGIEALRRRTDRGHAGWRQDDIFMACLGLAEEARQNVAARAGEWNKESRFPAFWGPNYDWVPDQDHGGVLMKALQAMLLQTDGREVRLYPAWPAAWEADFKLCGPGGRIHGNRESRP